jgi:hypothetical protein
MGAVTRRRLKPMSIYKHDPEFEPPHDDSPTETSSPNSLCSAIEPT